MAFQTASFICLSGPTTPVRVVVPTDTQRWKEQKTRHVIHVNRAFRAQSFHLYHCVSSDSLSMSAPHETNHKRLTVRNWDHIRN